MRPLAIHFVDPTIPGISGSDLVGRSTQAIHAGHTRTGGAPAAAARRFHAFRKALGDLDLHLLRDLGLDRSGS